MPSARKSSSPASKTQRTKPKIQTTVFLWKLLSAMREAFFDEGAGLDYDMNVWCDPAVLTTDVEMVTYMLEVQNFLDDCNDYNKKDAEAAVRTFFRPCSDRTMMKRAVKMMRETIVNAVFD